MLAFFVIFPLLIAIILFVFSTNNAVRVLAIVFQSIFVLMAFYLFIISYREEITTRIGSFDYFLGIHLRAYNVSSVMILLTTLIFLAIAIYGFNETPSRTFWLLLFILETTLIGLFLTRDLFNIFVLVEVGTIIITMLLMFDKKKRNLYHGMIFIMLNVVAMLFYLWGIGYLYSIVGAFDMAVIAERVSEIDSSQLVLPYSLMLTALAFKCSLIPLFSFTPKTNLYDAAPSAVAAILSGVQIKTSVYLFFRIQETFGDFAAHEFFLVLAVISSLLAVFMAISQSNIKLILAYHTISQVGLIMIGLSSGGEYSMIGGLYHIIAHGIFKSALFLTAGIIYRTYGTRNVYEIRGVMKRMPWVGVAMLFAVLGIMGAPLFIGFTSKYFIAYDVSSWVNIATIIISLGTIISFIKYSGMLFGPWEGGVDYGIGEDKWRLIPTVFLGFLCLLGGVFGVWLVNYLFYGSANISFSGYLEKTAIFGISFLAGYIIYKKVVYGNAFLKKISSLSFSFKHVCISIGVLFGCLLIVTGLLN